MNQIKLAETKKDKEAAFAVRFAVFVEEQKVPAEIEIDAFDETALHFVYYDESTPCGASRVRFVNDYGKIERLCILAAYRGKSYGKALMTEMEAEIKQNGYKLAVLNAQAQAIQFYEQLGYHVVSDVFTDAGIPHQTMQKQL